MNEEPNEEELSEETNAKPSGEASDEPTGEASEEPNEETSEDLIEEPTADELDVISSISILHDSTSQASLITLEEGAADAAELMQSRCVVETLHGQEVCLFERMHAQPSRSDWGYSPRSFWGYSPSHTPVLGCQTPNSDHPNHDELSTLQDRIKHLEKCIHELALQKHQQEKIACQLWQHMRGIPDIQHLPNIAVYHGRVNAVKMLWRIDNFTAEVVKHLGEMPSPHFNAWGEVDIQLRLRIDQPRFEFGNADTVNDQLRSHADQPKRCKFDITYSAKRYFKNLVEKKERIYGCINLRIKHPTHAKFQYTLHVGNRCSIPLEWDAEMQDLFVPFRVVDWRSLLVGTKDSLFVSVEMSDQIFTAPEKSS